MKSIYDYMLKSFKQGLKAAQADSGHVTITVKTELPVDDNRPLTAQFRKLNPNVRLPERNGAAWDLYLPEDVTIEAGQTVKIKLGFACKLPNGYSAFILMRSSTWGKWGICLLSSASPPPCPAPSGWAEPHSRVSHSTILPL